MNKLKTVMLIFLGILILSSGMFSKATAQVQKIGYVNGEKIKLEFKDWGRAQEQWEIERKAWDDEVIAKETELKELLDEYDKQKLILSDDKKREREAAIRVKREALDSFTREIYSPGGRAERKQIELIEPLLAKVNKAIKLFAEENNYDIIYDLAESGLAYIKESYDVTEQVLEKLDQIDE